MKTCFHCGTDFTPVRHQKFCTVNCGKHFRTKQDRADPVKSQRERELKKQRYHADKPKHREYARKWYSENAEAEKLRHKEYYEQNRDRVNAYMRERYKTKAPQIVAQVRERDARKRNQSPKLSSIERLMVNNYYERAKELTIEHGIEFSVDHITPINKGGLHAPWNLQVVTDSDNCRKRDKFMHIPAWPLI